MRSYLLLVVTMLVLTTGTVHAAGRKRAGLPNKQAAIGTYGRAVYPKYYWGLHAREFQNIGTPPGDKGIRGDGIQWQPW